MSDIRSDIEDIVGEYCDGTLGVLDGVMAFSLDKAHFIEYYVDPSPSAPQQCADRLVAYVEELLKDHGHA